MGSIPTSRLIIIGAAVFVGIFLLLIFTGVIPGLRIGGGNKPPTETQASLTMWGVFESEKPLKAAKDVSNLGAEIHYREVSADTFESELLRALATDQGPDIIMMHNTWLPKLAEHLEPVRPEQFLLADLQSQFPTIVEQDFAPDGKIYALPLYLDTLALFYNRDILDAKGEIVPPKSWEEFQDTVKRIREVDSSGRIHLAAAAIGGSARSINRATDIISLLMLQSGVRMVSPGFDAATFSSQGITPLLFYLKFANPGSEFYTWNDSLSNSTDWFSEEKVAMVLNYSHLAGQLKDRNPHLRFGVAPVPQPTAGRSVNYANYWGLAVMKKSKQSRAAWDFIIRLATNAQAMKTYSETASRPPALRTLIEAGKNDLAFGVFNRQALTARSWPQVDNRLVEKEFSSMVGKILTGEAEPTRAIRDAEAAISVAMDDRRNR